MKNGHKGSRAKGKKIMMHRKCLPGLSFQLLIVINTTAP